MRYSDRNGGSLWCLGCGKSVDAVSQAHADGSPPCWDRVFAPGRVSLPSEERSSEIEAKLRLNVDQAEPGEDRRIGLPIGLVLFALLVFGAVGGCFWYAWVNLP